MQRRENREEVLAWMAETGAGYKRAAKHFGLSPNTVKWWRRELAGKPRSTPRSKATTTESTTSSALAPAPPRPQREEVLAWMTATGAGCKLASKKFGVPLSTVKFWRSRQGADSGAAAGPAPKQIQPSPQERELARLINCTRAALNRGALVEAYEWLELAIIVERGA